MGENLDLITIEELTKENRRLKEDIRELRPLANLARVISYQESECRKWFDETLRVDAEVERLKIMVVNKDLEIAELRARISGEPKQSATPLGGGGHP